jgi:hypothetical protein
MAKQILVEEMDDECGIAWQAVCYVELPSGETCSWAGSIHHADEHDGEPDPADAAWGEATEDGKIHLEVEH